MKVKGKPGALVRTIVWRAPSSTGGAPITSYRVTVHARVKGRLKMVWAKNVPVGSTALQVRLRRTRLKTGVHQVRVRAANSDHTGAWATRRFEVSGG